MAVNENVLRLVRAFYNREIDDFSLYLEGFGGLFISRTKDGMVMGYKDKNKRLGIDDHVTVFFDKHGLKGLHRKVADAETNVYMKYDVEYFDSSQGIKKLVQDMQKRADVPLYMKPLLVLLYRGMEWAFEGTHLRSAKVLENSEARKLGMKPPCIYVKTGYVERLFFPLYDKTLVLETLINKFKFGESPSRVFSEQHYPGSQITKHPKKKKKS